MGMGEGMLKLSYFIEKHSTNDIRNSRQLAVGPSKKCLSFKKNIDTGLALKFIP